MDDGQKSDLRARLPWLKIGGGKKKIREMVFTPTMRSQDKTLCANEFFSATLDAITRPYMIPTMKFWQF